MSRVLVIAPHPDDEVLGVGGTMARLAHEDHDVFVAIVTRGDSSMFDPGLIEQGRQEALKAHRLLRVRDTIFMEGFPAALLDTVPHSRLNEALCKVLNDVKPQILFIPFNGDIHLDHRLVFESALVAARPNSTQQVQAIYAYETLSETNWNAPPLTPGFLPNTYFDISAFLEVKIEAMRVYQTQLKLFPHERSIKAIRALARLRGATVGFEAAEAFVLIRSVYPVGCDLGKQS
ncbi:MAG TPA: PIG-L family deacetylase [Anaerolineae bacterium]|nr:PIG-L family deacetylase [Anaerolineae bacterium]